MADSAQAPVQEHWSETNGKKYRRGSRLPKKTDTRPPVPAAETPKVPWTWEEDGMTVIRGTARSAPGCHNVCGILSYVKDGKLVKVEGDPEDPYNQGRLCSRCLCIPDYVYHEDRLVKPMKRDRADRGKDKFVECSWDEAYDIIVREFKRVVDTYGADKIAMCQGTGRDIHQVTRLNACVGSPNEGVPYFAGNSCYLPRIASMACMLGGACVMDCSQFLPQRYDDPRYTVPKYCIVWGHQPFYSNADGFYGHWITDLMKRGMKVAVIDPQLTWLAARAGEDWLRVRPGGDGALAMAMLKVVCDEKLYDQEFCDKWVYGLEAVCERVAEMDLDDLCEKSWVAKEDVQRVARTYAASKPAAIQWAAGTNTGTTSLISSMITNAPSTLPNSRMHRLVGRMAISRMFMGVMTGVGAARLLRKPMPPRARMPAPSISTMLISASAAVTSRSFVGGLTPNTPIRFEKAM